MCGFYVGGVGRGEVGNFCWNVELQCFGITSLSELGAQGWREVQSFQRRGWVDKLGQVSSEHGGGTAEEGVSGEPRRSLE